MPLFSLCCPSPRASTVAAHNSPPRASTCSAYRPPFGTLGALPARSSAAACPAAAGRPVRRSTNDTRQRHTASFTHGRRRKS